MDVSARESANGRTDPAYAKNDRINLPSKEIKITPVPVLTDNYVWIIEVNHKALVVDPGDAAPVLNYLNTQQLTLAGVLLTHHHGDHTNGVPGLLKHHRVPVIASAKSALPFVTHPLQDGETLSYLDFPTITGISIPGHTLDHMAFRLDHALFTGDTLFAAGCGRVFEGTFAMMYASLQKLAQLPAELAVYCGHEYTETNLRFAQSVEPNNSDIATRFKTVQAQRVKQEPTLPSTLALELATNPFLRCGAEDFAKLRQQKDVFR